MTISSAHRVHLLRLGADAVRCASESGVELRLLGGVAVALRCPSARDAGPLARDYSDLDFATRARHVKGATKVLKGMGFLANDRFNAAHGESRLMFAQPDGRHVDVFVDRFTLCHELPLKGRLDRHDTTLDLADLLLTKLQVAKLSAKDVSDAAAILLDHPVTDDASGVDRTRVGEILNGDWGWWRTCTETIDRLGELVVGLGLDQTQRQRVAQRLGELRDHVDATPKSLRWKARARIGERRPWREDPDDLEA